MHEHTVSAPLAFHLDQDHDAVTGVNEIFDVDVVALPMFRAAG
jgi:hypothetical protein